MAELENKNLDAEKFLHFAVYEKRAKLLQGKRGSFYLIYLKSNENNENIPENCKLTVALPTNRILNCKNENLKRFWLFKNEELSVHIATKDKETNEWFYGEYGKFSAETIKNMTRKPIVEEKKDNEEEMG